MPFYNNIGRVFTVKKIFNKRSDGDSSSILGGPLTFVGCETGGTEHNAPLFENKKMCSFLYLTLNNVSYYRYSNVKHAFVA